MPKISLKIATRRSPLALWQAHFVRDCLLMEHPELTVELVEMTTKGDQILNSPLSKVGGKGLFVKELEIAMLEGRADIAVHSMKDVPMEFPEGLELGVICEREDPTDALVSNGYKTLQKLPAGAVLGTSSLRRHCQLKALRPDLNIKDLRGNVNTRLAKLDNDEYDAIILASAGLKRLGMADRIATSLESTTCLPAVGQGAVGVEVRSGDTQTLQLLACLHHVETAERVTAERAMNNRLNGGCQVPIAGFAERQNGKLWLRGLVGSPDGESMLRGEATALPEDATQLGQEVADQLLAQGAGEILANIYQP